MSAAAMVGIVAACFVTSFISGVFGMAGGLVLMALLIGLEVPVPTAMAVHGVAQSASNVWRALLWWRYVAVRIFAWYVVGGIVTLGLLSLVRFVPDRALVLLLLGVIPFLALVLPARLVPQADRPAGAIVCGASSIGIQLVAGVSGPLLDTFFVRTEIDRRVIVATKAACQFVGNMSKIVYFASVGDAFADVDPWLLVGVIVLAFAGTFASRVVLERMSDANFRRWTRWIVLCAGAVCIVMGLEDLARR
jgi:uncharacterized membrane protein YfcA